MVQRLMLAVAMVAVLAAPSFAAVQNVKVGGDLKTTSVIRQNFDVTANPALNKNQNVILSQVGVNISADLTDNVSTTLRLVNERLWGTYDATGNNGNVNLDTAYVTMKEFLYAPLTVTVGRQPLAYGNKLIIGDGDSTSDISDVSDLTGGVNFDAVKAVLSYDPLTVDVFAAKVSEGTAMGQNDDDDKDLFGVNASYKLGDKMSTVVDAYVFAQHDKTVVTGEQYQADKLYVPGLRVSTNPIEGLNVQLEAAYQFGSNKSSANGTDKQAYAVQGGVTYALPVLKDMKPVLSAGYTLLSGDKDSTDSQDTAWDKMYEDQNTGRIFDTFTNPVTNSNIKIANVAFEITPLQDVTAKLTGYNLNLAKKTSNNQKVGNEVDLDVTYAYTEDVSFGVSTGVFFPGKYYDYATGEQKDNVSQILTSVAVAF